MAPQYFGIIEKLGKNRVRLNESMAKHTTFRIGGPADLFYEAKTEEELIRVVIIASTQRIPFFILGNGSNILVSDNGYRGLMIKNSVSGMKITGRSEKIEKPLQIASARYHDADPKKYLKFSDLDYPDEPLETEVEVFSGTSLQSLIRWSFENKLTGLQWFAGIPGTVGGAVVFNIHGGTRLFSNYIHKVLVLDKDKRVRLIEKPEVEFDYDFSDILKNNLLVLRVYLLLSRGDLSRARYVYREWWQRKKKIQPQKNCPGSIFKNLPEKIAKKLGAPTSGTGWFIEQVGLKGKKIGDAKISEKHANFIINLGKAKSKDVLELVKIIKNKVKEKFGVELKEEIIFLGFDKI